MALKLLELIFGKAYHHPSNLEKSDLIAKLKELVEDFSEKDKFKRKPFIGTVNEKAILICENVLVMQAFSAYFDAKIEVDGQGSRLTGKIRINRIIAVLLSFFLLFFVGISIVFVYLSGLDELIDLIMLIPIFIFFLILLMIFISISQETQQMEELLRKKINF